MSNRLNWEPLYKASGAKQVVWRISVEPVGQEADLVISYGYVDGQIQTQRERIKAGKNLGRANETTALEQAQREAEARWQKQLTRKGYGRTAAQSAMTRSVSPMLAHTYGKISVPIDWATAYTQRKLDGFRALARFVDGKLQLRSREGKPILTMPHIADALLPIFKAQPNLVLDGELYLHELHDFNKLASAVRRHQELSDKVRYHVYDQISAAVFRKRYEELQSVLKPVDPLRVDLVETIEVDDADAFALCQQRFIADGYEGAMLRHGLVGYEAGKRSKYLLKSKEWLDDEFVIVDVKEGRGTHAGMAVFTCVTAAGHNFDVLAPGDHEAKKAYWRSWQALLHKKVVVRYQEMSKSEEPSPRFPVALRVLED